MQTIDAPASPLSNEPRYDITAGSPHDGVAEFAQDVREGLTAPAKRLSPKYFYDDLGSALFEAICLLPEYGLTRAETEILARHADEIAGALPGPLEIVELGSGSGAKTRILLEALLRRQERVDYHPIDISPAALEASAAALTARYPGLYVHGHADDYFEVLRTGRLRTGGGRILALMLGSNIGNYEPPRAAALLRALRGALEPGDGVLLGVDLKRDPAAMTLAYDDPTGVTAAFEKNVLGRINRELGGDFDLRRFRHVARYDEEHGRVDSFLVSEGAQRVRIAALGLEVAFADGEPIHTESSYKYSGDDLGAMLHDARLARCERWAASTNDFAVILGVR